ncbi:MAG TPA: FliH/SctL family protein [Candidatus Acidoferrum sp.]|nr:FliH/SctL family protein [Candidatus Acidoferrum sp.]
MSKIVRHCVEGPTVSIGETQRDLTVEARAEKRMGALFPQTQLITAPDGSKLMPVTEVFGLEKTLEQERQQFKLAGYQEGYEAGLQKGLDEARQVLSRFDKAIAETVGQREALLDEARGQVLELVLKVSRKITFGAIQADPEATAAMISGVIDQLVDRSRLKIKVHPDHLPIVEQNISRFLAGSTAIKEIAIEADPRVRFGGCFIETPNGDIDARLESQFEVISEALVGAGEPA